MHAHYKTSTWTLSTIGFSQGLCLGQAFVHVNNITIIKNQHIDFEEIW